VDPQSWTTSDWFTAINSAALSWYSAAHNNGVPVVVPQPGQLPGGGMATIQTYPGGVTASVSPTILIVGALGIVALVYVLRK
jgi:hypothetical protein